ncbi:MAG: hypothetical protein LAO56_15420 [Acidobacteriia bacterium]|nr:hypothetical protein [Terriglobia bacterium]
MIVWIGIIANKEEADIGLMRPSVQPLIRDGWGKTIVVDSGSTGHRDSR